MSERKMNRIEEMTRRLCPEGVKMVKMEDLFEFKNGYTPSKNQSEFWEDGTIPWFRMEDIRQNGRILSDSIQHITAEAVKGGRLFPANSFILATTATIGEHALIIADSLANQRFTNLSVRKSLIDNVDIKYLFHYMFIVDEFCKRNVNDGSFASVDMKKLRKLTIPLPPLEVQRAIAEVLDKFSELEAELEAELDCRKRQYEYYRERLLSFKHLPPPECEKIRFVRLGEVGTFYGGLTGKSKYDFTDGNAKYLSYINVFSNPSLPGQIADFVKIKEGERQNCIQFGDIIFTGSSETPEEAGMTCVATHSPHEKIYLNSFCFGFRFYDISLCNFEFLKHLLRSRIIRKNIVKTASGVTRFNISKQRLSTLTIPLPPLPEQKRIADILDRFERLTSDLGEGLPAEIAARRRQYEHYRERLLSFGAEG